MTGQTKRSEWFRIVGWLVVFFFQFRSTQPSDLDPKLLSAIEEEALKLNLADFDGDPIFIQSVDVTNGMSTYRLLKSDSNENSSLHETPTLERVGDDEGREVISFPSNRRRGNSGGKENSNAFVVLRRIPPRTDEDKSTYYATYAYTR